MSAPTFDSAPASMPDIEIFRHAQNLSSSRTYARKRIPLRPLRSNQFSFYPTSIQHGIQRRTRKNKPSLPTPKDEHSHGNTDEYEAEPDLTPDEIEAHKEYAWAKSLDRSPIPARFSSGFLGRSGSEKPVGSARELKLELLRSSMGGSPRSSTSASTSAGGGRGQAVTPRAEERKEDDKPHADNGEMMIGHSRQSQPMATPNKSRPVSSSFTSTPTPEPKSTPTSTSTLKTPVLKPNLKNTPTAPPLPTSATKPNPTPKSPPTSKSARNPSKKRKRASTSPPASPPGAGISASAPARVSGRRVSGRADDGMGGSGGSGGSGGFVGGLGGSLSQPLPARPASSDTEEEDEEEIEAGLLPLDTPLPPSLSLSLSLSARAPAPAPATTTTTSLFPRLALPRDRNPLEYGEEEDELETPYATPVGTPVPYRAAVIPGRLTGGVTNLAGISTPVSTSNSTPTKRRRQAGRKSLGVEASPSPSASSNLGLSSEPVTVSPGVKETGERGEETVRRSTRGLGALGLGLGRRGDAGDRVASGLRNEVVPASDL